MKKYFLIPVALFIFAACSNSETTQENHDDDDAIPGSKVEALIDALEDDSDTLEVKAEEPKSQVEVKK